MLNDPLSSTSTSQEACPTLFGLATIYSILTTLIDRLDEAEVVESSVIQWGCPVPSFGDLASSRVATLGINPSNREFMDELGKELKGPQRRLETLDSLGLVSWSDADPRHLHLILESCRSYFLVNPYDTWFRKLDVVVSGAGASYYHRGGGACHLDLIPYATSRKWSELTLDQRSTLLGISSNSLGLLLRASPIEILILNGRSVVEQFEDIAGISLDRHEMPGWSLPRQSRRNVLGIAYKGIVESIAGIMLEHNVLVLGFNHNLQSSFGVTAKVISKIRSWIAQASKEEGNEAWRP